MRINIALDDDLVTEAFTCAESIHTKRELIETALREFIRTKKMKDLGDLKGAIQFAEIAIENKLFLLHNDRDFGAISRVVKELKIFT